MSAMPKVVSDEERDRCVSMIISKLKKSPQNRILIGIAGRPGGGKTTVAEILAAEVRRHLNNNNNNLNNNNNNNLNNNNNNVVVMPMDGYHYYRKQLKEMPNSAEAIDRRGAEWTFDPRKLCKDLQAIRLPKNNNKINNNLNNNNIMYSDVYVPSFDHGVGDPVERDIIISGAARVIIAEGNYLLYRGTPAWAEVNRNFDFTIFLSCSPLICARRLCKRHMAAWKITEEAAMVRANGSDKKNGDLVDKTKENADFIMHSIEYPSGKI